MLFVLEVKTITCNQLGRLARATYDIFKGTFLSLFYHCTNETLFFSQVTSINFKWHVPLIVIFNFFDRYVPLPTECSSGAFPHNRLVVVLLYSSGTNRTTMYASGIKKTYKRHGTKTTTTTTTSRETDNDRSNTAAIMHKNNRTAKEYLIDQKIFGSSFYPS